MNIEIQFDLKDLLSIGTNFYAVANSALRETADFIVKEAQDNIDPSRSGLHNRSGNLRDSIKVTRYVQLQPNSIGEVSVIAGNNDDVRYAGIHEEGGTIQAKNKPYLTFNINGNWIKKKEVKIPARPYLAPALEAGTEAFQPIFEEKFVEIFNNI